MGLIVQVAVFVMMTVVGLDLTVADFRRLLDQPRTPVVATLGQWFLLPLTAWAVAWLLPLPAHLFAGMILLAASPAGGISNYYSYLARADVALSVSLTAISTMASAVTMPLIAAAGFRLFLASESEVSAPVGQLALQLVLLIVVPVVLGMAIRHRFPAVAERHKLKVRRASELLFLASVAWLVIGLRHTLVDSVGSAVLATVVFTVLAASLGLVVGHGLGTDRRQIVTLMIEFAVRNTAIPIMVGISVLGLPQLAIFAVVFLLVQLTIFFTGMGISSMAVRYRASSSGRAGCSD